MVDDITNPQYSKNMNELEYLIYYVLSKYPVSSYWEICLMRTDFSPAQLNDSHMAASEKILRSCVHCGFCTATCPTYLLLGDELDSPRGRIYLIKDMLENDRPASAEVVKHVDRCLSC